MKRTALILALSLGAPMAWAGQSTITEADGESCMGDDKSRRETEQVALDSAKRLAIDFSSTHISSSTVVENFQLKQDIVEAFAQAEVRVLKILEEQWQEPTEGDCYTIKIQAEVIPNDGAMNSMDKSQMLANPHMPLNVNLWVNSRDNTYTEGESLKVYLQGNKPFYARLIYVDAAGNNVQILPNQHRRDNYFAGQSMFEVPTGNDPFVLNIGEPFGTERLILYASTSPLGQIDTTEAGNDYYLVTDPPQEIAAKTRGITIKKASAGDKKASQDVEEFAEAELEITTSPAASS